MYFLVAEVVVVVHRQVAGSTVTDCCAIHTKSSFRWKRFTAVNHSYHILQIIRAWNTHGILCDTINPKSCLKMNGNLLCSHDLLLLCAIFSLSIFVCASVFPFFSFYSVCVHLHRHSSLCILFYSLGCWLPALRDPWENYSDIIAVKSLVCNRSVRHCTAPTEWRWILPYLHKYGTTTQNTVAY